MGNSAALAIRRKHTARPASTSAFQSWRQSYLEFRPVHARVDESLTIACPGDVDCHGCFLHVFVNSVQMMLARCNSELRSILSNQFGREPLANTLKYVELVKIAIHPGDIVSVPHHRLVIAIGRTLPVEIYAVEDDVLICVRNSYETAPERGARAGLGIGAVQTRELHTFNPGIREH